MERATGRIKNYCILKGTLPLSLAKLANRIVCICAWLTNFQTVPTADSPSEDDVDEYLEQAFESDYDADESDTAYDINYFLFHYCSNK